MENISYFKLQAKNLYRDFKLDFMNGDEAYSFSPQFYDINQIISDFNIDTNDFTLMKAQHIIAKLVGFSSWNELLDAPKKVLDEKKDALEHLGIKVRKHKIYHINLSAYEKIVEEGRAGDYLLRCPKLKELEDIITTYKPNCYFMSCNVENLEVLQNDKEHFYVNVCPHSSIRVLVPTAKYPDWYAVSVKNI
ncbi:MAG: hypothetical protein NC218_02710 [Acetobacter sp.]|nr:hypothetical protein [Acetobacter sp.]